MKFTEQSLQAGYKALDAMMALATEGMDDGERVEFEINVIGLYLGAQVATYKTEQDRSLALTSIISTIRQVVAERDRVAEAA